MTRPLVSVIIPCRNGAATLPGTLANVTDQRWPAVEIIVVENGSTDDSANVARAALARHQGPWQVIVSAAHGQNAARELGFAHCRGDYVQWLDADDAIGPDKIERQVLAGSLPQARRRPWRLGVGANDSESARARRRPCEFPGVRDRLRPPRVATLPTTRTCGRLHLRYRPTTDYLLRLLADWWAPPHAYLLRRHAALWLHEHRAWNPQMPCASDREYFTSAALHGFRFLHVRGAATTYCTRPGSGQATKRIGPATRVQALAGMQQRLAALPRRPDAPPLHEHHQFLLQQDRRLWQPPRAADLKASASAKRGMRPLHEGYARIPYTDTLEQHSKILAWQVPEFWERHLAILRELHRLRDAGAIHPVANPSAAT